jgi:sec-independent protein translocase protein TatB
MFDIGFPELMLVAVVGLLVIGPDRLPETLRTLGLWLGRMRRSFLSVKTEIEKEIGMDEVRRQLHNESIMEEMKRIEDEVKKTTTQAKDALDSATEEASIYPGSPAPSTNQADVESTELEAQVEKPQDHEASDPALLDPGAEDKNPAGSEPATPENKVTNG